MSNEERLRTLDRYDVVDSDPEPAFNRLAELAAQLCGAPLSLISFITADRVFIKAAYGDWGPPPLVIPLELSCCAEVIHRCSLYVIDDAGIEPKLADNPFVHGPAHLRFYAGVPIIAEGQAIGSICVLAREPRTLSSDQARSLAVLAGHVMDVLEARRELLELRRAEGWRAEAVEALLATKADLESRVELRTRDVLQAHERTRHILERVKDGFVALDREWRYLYVNERAGSLLGRSPDQLIGKHIWTEFPEGVGQPFQLAYERAMREQTTITFEEHYAPWNRWFENRIYPSPDGLSIFFTEITERKLGEKELQRSHDLLREAQRLARVGSWEWDAQRDTVSWSDELHRIYGVPREGFVGTYESFLSRVHPDDLEHTRAVISDAYQHPKPFAYDHRIVRPDGGVRMLHTRGEVLTDEQGRTRGMLGSCWDTTEQWQAGMLLDAALDLLPVPALAVVSGGRAIAVNAALRSLVDPKQLEDQLIDCGPELSLRLSDGRELRGTGERRAEAWLYRFTS